MPIVNIDIVPELMQGDKETQYKEIVSSVTKALAESIKAPQETVHVMIREVSVNRYAVAGKMLSNKLE